MVRGSRELSCWLGTEQHLREALQPGGEEAVRELCFHQGSWGGDPACSPDLA